MAVQRENAPRGKNHQGAEVKYNKMSFVQFHQLCEWLRGKDITGIYAHAELARQATKELEFNVSTTSCKDALTVLFKRLDERPPTVSHKAKPLVLDFNSPSMSRFMYLAQLVRDLYDKLGEPIPKGLDTLVNGD